MRWVPGKVRQDRVEGFQKVCVDLPNFIGHFLNQFGRQRHVRFGIPYEIIPIYTTLITFQQFHQACTSRTYATGTYAARSANIQLCVIGAKRIAVKVCNFFI